MDTKSSKEEEDGLRQAVVESISESNITIRFLDNDEISQENIEQLGLDGVKVGDIITIDVVEEEYYEGEDHEEVRVTMIVPPGATPGEIIMLQLNERTVDFVIPPGAKEGDAIEIKMEELIGSAQDDGQEKEDKDGAYDEVEEVLAGAVESSLSILKGEGEEANHSTINEEIGTTPIDGDEVIEESQQVLIEVEVPENCVPGEDTLTFQSADGRLFSLLIPPESSAGDIFTLQLPGVPRSDDGKVDIKPVIQSDAAIANVSESIREKEDGITIKTIVEQREDGTIIKTVETTTELPNGQSSVETETIIEQTRKHNSLREIRNKMREEARQKKQDEEDARQKEAPTPQYERPKPKLKAEGTSHLLLGDAEDFYAAGEIRSGGRYTFNPGIAGDKSDENENEGETNPFQEVHSKTGASEWYTAPETTKEVFDVEESRTKTMERSAACKQFEEDRAAVFDEDGNEIPTPQLVIALEAAAIVHMRKAEGLNERLDAMVAKDEETKQTQRCQVWLTK